MPKRNSVKPDEYHLIDIVSGESHGGFFSLDAARIGAREAGLLAWQIFHRNDRVEQHDPDSLASGGILIAVTLR
jgi:hypothetical protein